MGGVSPFVLGEESKKPPRRLKGSKHPADEWGNREGAWLGAYSPNKDLNFQWANGEPWDYTHWSSGEPNFLDEDAVIYFGPGNTIQNVWNNVGRTYPAYGFVIEATQVPEPSSCLLLLGGLSALFALRRRGR